MIYRVPGLGALGYDYDHANPAIWEQSAATINLKTGARQANNPGQFATAAYAAQLATLLGGKVVEKNLDGTYYQYTVPQRVIRMSDGTEFIAGLVADIVVNDKQIPSDLARYYSPKLTVAQAAAPTGSAPRATPVRIPAPTPTTPVTTTPSTPVYTTSPLSPVATDEPSPVSGIPVWLWLLAGGAAIYFLSAGDK